MDREEVRKAAEVMLAFADGKEIQYSYKGSSNWMDWINDYAPSFDFEGCSYRIKPVPKYRPFENREECWREMHKHPDFGWLMSCGDYLNIADIWDDAIYTIEHSNGIDYEDTFKTLTFTDGTPFGIEI